MNKPLSEQIHSYREKLRFKRKLRAMDRWWRLMGSSCFDPYPPSFYYTHTEEEIRRITEELVARLRAMIEEADQPD